MIIDTTNRPQKQTKAPKRIIEEDAPQLPSQYRVVNKDWGVDECWQRHLRKPSYNITRLYIDVTETSPST